MSEAGGKLRDLNVICCIPSNGTVPMGFALSLAQAMAHFASLPYDGQKKIGLWNVRSSNLAEGRQRLVAKAMEDQATHIMWFDSDMKFPPDTITRLLNHAKPVVGVNYPQKNIEARPTAYLDSPDYVGPVYSGERATGLQEVSVLGMGVMLTELAVFDVLPLPHFKFTPLPPENTRHSGEDVHFCHELSKLGIPVFVDHDLSKECAHIGEFEYTNQLSKDAEQVKQALYRQLP